MSIGENLSFDAGTKIFTVPGLYNSGPEHWQSQWERRFPGMKRILQKDWDTPVCQDWIAQIDAAVQSAGPSDVVLVAHSLGCATIAHWAHAYSRPIRGAMLVGPSDVEAPTYPPGTSGFIPVPLQRLPFRSVVVASADDPYVSVSRARLFAESWGSEYVEIGNAGHINASSGFGAWEDGLQILKKLAEG